MFEARDAIQEAAVACDHHHNATSIGIVGCHAANDILLEAHSLRAESVHERNVAETRLWSLQDEHSELLERLAELSQTQKQRLKEQRAEADAAASREAALVERCGQLDNEVRSLRREVDAKSQQLVASTARGHSLELRKRALQRQHEGSLVENEVAREILALQQGTEAHLQHVNGECSNLDQCLELAQKNCADKLEELQAEWSEQHLRYETEMDAFHHRLEELQQEYDERWKATETSTRQVIQARSQHATESRQKLEQEILKVDKEWEKNAITSREVAEEQSRIMSDARQAAVSEMEAKLRARQQSMEEQVITERVRNDAVRSRHLHRMSMNQEEVLHYKRCIGDLSLGYRRKTWQKSACSPPHGQGSGRTSPGLIQSGQFLMRD
jgi:hypothetical protein